MRSGARQSRAEQSRAEQGHPQHPDQKQRNRLKNPPRWGVCGAGGADAGCDCIVVSGAAADAADAISNSICSDINSLSSAFVWSLLNSITASIRLLMTPVV